jgi:hypothetical protein
MKDIFTSNYISEQTPEIRFLEGAIGDFLQAPVAIRTQKKGAVHFADVTTDDLCLAGVTAAKNFLNLGAFHRAAPAVELNTDTKSRLRGRRQGNAPLDRCIAELEIRRAGQRLRILLDKDSAGIAVLYRVAADEIQTVDAAVVYGGRVKLLLAADTVHHRHFTGGARPSSPVGRVHLLIPLL